MTDYPNFDLTGTVAIITGGTRGIGLAIAEAFVAAGARVVVASRKQENVDASVAKLREAGGDVLGITAHTGSQEAVNALVSRTVETFGGVDILVNNAATNPHFGPILTAEESHWEKILDINVKGYFRMVKACVPAMQKRGGGKIINVASIAGRVPLPGMGVYSVSKAAVLMLTEALAVELAPLNIQVNAIAPGLVKTRFSAALWQNPQIYEAVTKAIPQRRMAEPEEIAGIALYLASPASSFTTGATIVVDGGQVVGGAQITS
jgi:NAD(P)-dependent dehydrogenase (short-subunit alcohol dehydrogenase family)